MVKSVQKAFQMLAGSKYTLWRKEYVQMPYSWWTTGHLKVCPSMFRFLAHKWQSLLYLGNKINPFLCSHATISGVIWRKGHGNSMDFLDLEKLSILCLSVSCIYFTIVTWHDTNKIFTYKQSFMLTAIDSWNICFQNSVVYFCVHNAMAFCSKSHNTIGDIVGLIFLCIQYYFKFINVCKGFIWRFSRPRWNRKNKYQQK